MKITQGSWKTTSSGLLAISAGLVGLWFKRNNLDEGTVMAAATGILSGIGLLLARDNDKSSEDVKAKPALEPGGTGPKAGESKIGLWILGLLLPAMLITGCVTPAPGADPLVVQAEALAEGATESLDAFVQWEYRNRAGLGRDATAAADLVREFAPTYIRQLRESTKQYKALRSPDNQERLNAAIATLQQLLDTVRNYYTPKIATT